VHFDAELYSLFGSEYIAFELTGYSTVNLCPSFDMTGPISYITDSFFTTVYAEEAEHLLGRGTHVEHAVIPLTDILSKYSGTDPASTVLRPYFEGMLEQYKLPFPLLVSPVGEKSIQQLADALVMCSKHSVPIYEYLVNTV